ncbi:alpha/beta fold hydrolase [Alkalibacillus salilacus]|uniref:Pimeloyl-ACP methyl ester carboxylesterase n=1 Tax=Alkalibacillus salilacus TaxID=284582 RepID=A0ABT9VIQ8_9BACI|nr:alpha/beta fold hydrolase [Alkalibacillus salilacus]MDQ0160757.1 pimeloyl-ACP methyl ester carboxylesterase [Alkalibacillus salilacus]
MWDQQFIHTERGEFEVFTQGTGEPLCITHLYSEFNELGNYFADAFVNDFKVYLINLKEAGHSCRANTDTELSMKETVKDLDAIRDALNYKSWGFAGHSTGGMLGLVYALSYPDSLTKLLIGGATATKTYMDHEESMYSPNSPLNKKLKQIFSVLKSPDSTKEERKEANREWGEMSLYNPDRWDEYFSKPSSGKVVQQRLDYFSFKELPDCEIQDQLHTISVPSIVFCGRYDAQCPLVFSQDISRGLQNSNLYVFEKSNHFPFVEEKDQFADMVSDFKRLN